MLPSTRTRLGRLGFLLVFCLPLVAFSPGGAQAAVELVMFRAKACLYCEAWDHDIGGIYHKTDEGRAAPLRIVDMDGRRPADLERIEGIVYSPTFVLVDGDREVGRISGYPGPDFFWPLLGNLLREIEERE